MKTPRNIFVLTIIGTLLCVGTITGLWSIVTDSPQLPASSSDVVQTAAVQNVAYLPEHFTWNTNSTSGSFWGLPSSLWFGLNEVITGLAPSHQNLPNLHVNIPSIGPGGSAVRGIASLAFHNRNNVIQATFPNSMEAIGSAFNSSRLTQITIPDSVTAIANSAFRNNQITAVTLGAGLSSLHSSAFIDNPIQTINVTGNTQFRVENNSLIQNSNNTLVMGSQNAHMPASAASIGASAFWGRGVTNIVIPSNITGIELSAFRRNPIENLIIQGNLTLHGHEYGHGPFQHPFNVPTFIPILAEGITSIPALLFGGARISDISIPSTVTHIGTDAFATTQMTRIFIPDTVTHIETGEFFDQWGSLTPVEQGLLQGGTIVDIDGIPHMNLWSQYHPIVTIGAFANNPNLTIFTAHRTQPAGWQDGWNDGRPVIWGAAGTLILDTSITGKGTISPANDLPLIGLAESETRTLTGNPSIGWGFEQWDLTGLTQSTSTDNPITITMGEEDIGVTAVFEPILFDIAFNNMNDAANPNPTTFTIDDLNVSLQDASRYGYDFLGWYTNPEFYGSPITAITAVGNVRLYARWSDPLVSSITLYNLRESDTHSTPSTFVAADLNITLLPVTRSGWTWHGWYRDAGFTQPITEITAFGDITIHARLTINELAVEFDESSLHDATHTNPSIFTIDSETHALTAPNTRNGFTFAGWYTEQNGGGDRWTTVPVGEVGSQTLYAQWTLNEYSISFYNLQGTTHTNPTVFNIETPKTTLVNPAARAGYTFDGWWTELENGTQITEIELGSFGNMTLFARWSADYVRITFDSKGGNFVEGQNVQHTIGRVTEPADPTRTLYRFMGWSFDFANTPVTAPLTLYASWERINIDSGDTGITVEPGPDSEIIITVPGDPDTIITVNPGGDPVVTITPPNDDIIVDGPNADGEIVITIPGDNEDEYTVIVIRPDEDPPVVIYPPAVRFTVTFNSLGGTSVSSQRIAKGETAARPTSARVLHRLIGWSHNDALFDFDIPITETKTLYAVWERIDIDSGDTGIIVKPGDTNDSDNPDEDNDIVIIIPGEPDTTIVVRPDPENDGGYKVIVTPPNDDINYEVDDDGTITITVPDDDNGYTTIIVRPGEDPPVIIIPPNIGNNYPDPDSVLAAPSGLEIVSGRWLVWNGDERADGFTVYINGEYWATLLRREGRTNKVDLNLFGKGTYTFQVRAISEVSSLYNSDKSEAITFRIGDYEGTGTPPYPDDVLPDSEPELPNRLPPPKNVAINNNIITWIGTNNATGFAIYSNGIRLQLIENITGNGNGTFSYNLGTHNLGNGMAIFSARALGNGISTNDSFLSLGTILRIESQSANGNNLTWLWVLLGAVWALVLAALVAIVLLIRAKRRKTI